MHFLRTVTLSSLAIVLYRMHIQQIEQLGYYKKIVFKVSRYIYKNDIEVAADLSVLSKCAARCCGECQRYLYQSQLVKASSSEYLHSQRNAAQRMRKGRFSVHLLRGGAARVRDGRCR